ncbi:hypothetical protein [Ulvibacterium sp.]|uniref:hypothetical protein n=1 Tax=Ulvibacterium sp. TaxID=2665914 RepID=UPI0026212B45|nr:hypothetical protein [Ulvibacterium sp.]
MELEKFEEIRTQVCARYADVTEGKMMRSPAIHYKKKVFAFLSRKNKMVFKFGKDYPIHRLDVQMQEFSPFKTKKPLKGWYEVDFDKNQKWENLTEIALQLIKEKG